MNRTLAGLLVLGALGLSGCSSLGGSNCRGLTGDAGSTARAVGEPCSDGVGCQPGLRCDGVNAGRSDVAYEECLAPCGDAGTCPSGSACLGPDGVAGSSCHPTCVTSADCTGAFDRFCLGLDGGSGPGVCVARSCDFGASTCSSGASCIHRYQYCCPPGAPCPAPPPGLCLR